MVFIGAQSPSDLQLMLVDQPKARNDLFFAFCREECATPKKRSSHEEQASGEKRQRASSGSPYRWIKPLVAVREAKFQSGNVNGQTFQKQSSCKLCGEPKMAVQYKHLAAVVPHGSHCGFCRGRNSDECCILDCFWSLLTSLHIAPTPNHATGKV